MTATVFEGTVLHYRNNHDQTFEQLRNRVATPNGVTEAGLKTMDNFEQYYDTVFNASYNRAQEMLAASKNSSNCPKKQEESQEAGS